MSELTQPQVDQLRRQLVERRAHLRGEIVDVRARTSEQPFSELAATPEIGDEATADLLIDIDNAMVDRDIQEIRAIDGALARIDDGSYGDCVDCGLPIDVERLEAFPAAQRCVVCQGRREKTHAHGARPTL